MLWWVLMLVSNQDPCTMSHPPLFPQQVQFSTTSILRVKAPLAEVHETELLCGIPCVKDLITELQTAVLQQLRWLCVGRTGVENKANGLSPFVCVRSTEVALPNTDQTILSSFVYPIIKCWVHSIQVDWFMNTNLSGACTCFFKWNQQVFLWYSTLALSRYILSLCQLALNSSFFWFPCQGPVNPMADSLQFHIIAFREGKSSFQKRADKLSS